MISNTAFDKLLAIYERDRILWAAVFPHHFVNGEYFPHVNGLRLLAKAHGINPNA